MAKKPVSELEGEELDRFVALADGYKDERPKDGQMIKGNHRILVGIQNEYSQSKNHEYSPSTNWNQAGPIIERAGISLMRRLGKDGVCSSYYHAQVGPEEPENNTLMTHENPLVAAMRSFVASKFGEYVETP
jgi:hypothetical protein